MLDTKAEWLLPSWLFVVFVLMAVAFPVVNGLLIYPAFQRIIVAGVEEDAARLSKHMLPELFSTIEVEGRTTLSLRELAALDQLDEDFNITKLKVFNEDGVVIYSSDAADMGSRNSNQYFFEIVASGRTFSKLVQSGTTSMEGVVQSLDVVETYIPVMSDGRFQGALEVYYNVSTRKARFDNLAFWSLLATALLSLALVALVYLVMKRQKAYIQVLEKHRDLREDIDRILQHDLKSPLSNIISGINYLSTEPLCADQLEIVGQLHATGWRMMRMITSSLDLYKMETGTYVCDSRPVDLVKVVQSVQTELADLITSCAIDVRLDTQGAGAQGEVVVAAEDPLCHTLVANLLKNAVEACISGSRVGLRLFYEDQWGVLEITNPGELSDSIGPNLFDKYVTSGKKGGLGLGTYSARLSAVTQGGQLTCDTRDGLVVFTLRLPRAKSDT